ncbi:DUF1328 domain-containing protein [Acaryochloris marina]|uniref:DUF1328 domain-containing protein n=1 Tax=Acaryochloris marina TaxID=155978 RepID=UPI0021C3E023|nr:DUF1328 domain-containing protein [Acaryochloris marina]BDM78868.1 hypothetical protein AM10699_17370 [Acaryochloris marina MBIC10699]
MLNLTLTFLVVALIAAFLGFSGIAASAAAIAKILFCIFIVCFILVWPNKTGLVPVQEYPGRSCLYL